MLQTVIVDSGNQIEAQTEPLAPIPIPLCQNPKYLQISENMFNHNSHPPDFTIAGFFFFRQLSAFRLFLWRSTIPVQFLQSLVTFIAQFENFFRQLDPTLFVKLEIVDRSRSVCRRHNLFRFYVRNDLRLDGVPLFLPTVVSLLFFLGRSIGVSPTSTTTISKARSFCLRTFLPGIRNSGQSFKISSTDWMIRQTVLSDKPQGVAMWNCVRYSRQYSKVKRTWFGTDSFGGLPATRRRDFIFSATRWHIFSKVFFFTPQYRLNCVAERSFSFS